VVVVCGGLLGIGLRLGSRDGIIAGGFALPQGKGIRFGDDLWDAGAGLGVWNEDAFVVKTDAAGRNDRVWGAGAEERCAVGDVEDGARHVS